MTYRCQKKSVVGSRPPPDRDSIYLPLTYDADYGSNAMDESLSPRVKRKYIDPWDLENYAYINRCVIYIHNENIHFLQLCYTGTWVHHRNRQEQRLVLLVSRYHQHSTM